MKALLLGVVLAGLFSLNVAEGADSVDYKNCMRTSMAGMGMGGPNTDYQLSASGDFSAEMKGRADGFSSSANGRRQEVTLKGPGLGYGAAMKMKYVLTKDSNGRATSVESAWLDAKGRPFKSAFGASGARFGYEGSKCRVEQAFFRDAEGKDQVFYDDALCSSLAAALKKLGKKKLQECSDTLSEMESAVQRAADRLEGDNKALSVSFYPGAFPGTQAAGNGSGFGSAGDVFLIMSSCNMTRLAYGMPVDTETVLPMPGYPGGKVMGGSNPLVEELPEGTSTAQ